MTNMLQIQDVVVNLDQITWILINSDFITIRTTDGMSLNFEGAKRDLILEWIDCKKHGRSAREFRSAKDC